MTNDVDLTFGPVLVMAKNFAAVIARSARLEESGVDRDLVYFYSEGSWSCISSLGVGCTMAFDAKHSELLVVTNDGLAQVIDASGSRAECIDKSQDGPSNLQAINGVARVGDDIVAYGMCRQVYLRTARGVWKRIDDGIRTNDVGGIKSICGSSASDMYSVGFGGELWCRQGDRWEQIDSPTNAKLEMIAFGSSGECFACGAAGIILRGRGHRWTVLQQNIVKETLWAVADYRHEIFFASTTSLLKLKDGGLKPMQGLPGDPKTFGFLSTDGHVLWSSGSLDLLSYDGESWTRIEPPPTEENT